jgi:hypothetical protein
MAQSCKETSILLAQHLLGLKQSAPGVPSGFINLVRETYNKHKKEFEEALSQLNHDRVDLAIARTLEGMFADGKCNWGRVATVYAFSIAVASLIGKELAVVLVGGFVTECLTAWIIDQGGWSRARPPCKFWGHTSLLFSAIAKEIAEFSPILHALYLVVFP